MSLSLKLYKLLLKVSFPMEKMNRVLTSATWLLHFIADGISGQDLFEHSHYFRSSAWCRYSGAEMRHFSFNQVKRTQVNSIASLNHCS